VFDSFLSTPGGSLRQLREVLLLRAHLHGRSVAMSSLCWAAGSGKNTNDSWDNMEKHGITWD
jgi:hypothetical protein